MLYFWSVNKSLWSGLMKEGFSREVVVVEVTSDKVAVNEWLAVGWRQNWSQVLLLLLACCLADVWPCCPLSKPCSQTLDTRILLPHVAKWFASSFKSLFQGQKWMKFKVITVQDSCYCFQDLPRNRFYKQLPSSSPSSICFLHLPGYFPVLGPSPLLLRGLYFPVSASSHHLNLSLLHSTA